MRTIDKLLKYPLSDRDKILLEERGHVNNCGGKGGVNFDNLFVKLEKRINNLPYKNKKKLSRFFKDLTQLCKFNHDIDCSLGGGIKDYIKAHYNFSMDVIKLLHWTNAFGRIFIFITLFTGLNVFGIKYFSWGKRKILADLLR